MKRFVGQCFSTKMSSRKCKFDLLHSDVRDHFSVFFIISAGEVFDVDMYFGSDELLKRQAVAGGQLPD